MAAHIAIENVNVIVGADEAPRERVADGAAIDGLRLSVEGLVKRRMRVGSALGGQEEAAARAKLSKSTGPPLSCRAARSAACLPCHPAVDAASSDTGTPAKRAIT